MRDDLPSSPTLLPRGEGSYLFARSRAPHHALIIGKPLMCPVHQLLHLLLGDFGGLLDQVRLRLGIIVEGRYPLGNFIHALADFLRELILR